MLVFLLLALFTTIIWSLFDRRRDSYQQLLYWVSVVVRYYLAMNMFGYGFAKIFHLQMPHPLLSELIQPLGDKSPMGLAWTYIGFSKEFSFFTGLAEVIAGCFLFFRRTVTFGALVCAMVTINILAINLFFDVPVKLFSATLFLMSLFLLASDLKRLINFFLLNKPTTAAVHPINIKRRWLRISSLVTKCLFIVYLFYGGVAGGIMGQKAYGDKKMKPPLYGLYDTELVIFNGDTVPPLITDPNQWRTLVIQREKNAIIKMMNDSLKNYSFIVDTVKKQISFADNNSSLNNGKLQYEKKENYLILSGTTSQDSIYMRLKERDLKSFRLINRGFRWVNEYPYNR